MSRDMGELALKRFKDLRKIFDLLRKEYGGLPVEDPDLRLNFFNEFFPHIEESWKRFGIDPFPVIIGSKVLVRDGGGIKPIMDVKSKGNIVRRRARATSS